MLTNTQPNSPTQVARTVMRSRATHLLIGLAVVLTGCATDDRVGSPTPHDPTTVDDSRGSSLPDDLLVPFQPRPVVRGCGLTDGDVGESIAAVLVDDDLQLIRVTDDGQQVETVFTFGLDSPEAEMAYGQTLFHRDGFTLATGLTQRLGAEPGPYGPTTAYDQEIVLVNAEGEVLWTRLHDVGTSYRFQRAELGKDGTVVIGRSYDDAFSTQLVSPSGVVTTFEGVALVDRPGSDGRVPVSWASGEVEGPYGPSAVYDYGLLDPATGSIATFDFATQVQYMSTRWVGDWWLLWGSDAEGVQFYVTVRGDEVRPLEIPADQGYAQLLDMSDEAILLAPPATYAEEPEPAVLWRVSLETGALETIEIDAPEGMRRMGQSDDYYCYYCSPVQMQTLDAEGNLLMTFRDDDSAAIFRSPDGSSWEQLGDALGQIQAALSVDAGGTYLIQSTNQMMYYAPMEAWGEDDETYGYAADPEYRLQVVRPTDDLRYDVSDVGESYWYGDTQHLISPDGSCLAFWELGEDGILDLLGMDVEEGELRSLMTMDTAELSSYARQMVWMTDEVD